MAKWHYDKYKPNGTFNLGEHTTELQPVNGIVGNVIDAVSDLTHNNNGYIVNVNGEEPKQSRALDTMTAIANSVPLNQSAVTNIMFKQSAINYAYNDEQIRASQALDYANKLHIGADVILNGGEDGFRNAATLAAQVDRGRTIQEIYDEYPELYKVKYNSQAEGIQAIQNLQSVKATRGVFDAIEQSVWAMNDQIKLGNVGFELAHTTDKDRIKELTDEMERLQGNLQQYRKVDVLDSPFQAIVGDTTAQTYMMGKHGGRGAIIGAIIGGVIGGVATDGVGISSGAATGAKWGGGIDMTYNMYKMSFGNKYLELVNKRDAQGNRVYSNDEAYKYAMTYAAVDTGIEMVSTRFMIKGIGKVAPASIMSKSLQGATSNTIKTFDRGIGATVGQMAKTSLKAGGSELVEEGLQDINEKVQHNLYRNANDLEDAYSVGDIALGAGGAMLQALPAVIGLGTLGGGVSGVHNMKAFHEFQKLTPEQQQQAVMAEQNRNGHAIMHSLKQDASSNQIAKENPELYGKIVQAQGDKVGVSTAYVNVNEMAETEQGQLAIKNMIDSGLVTQEEVSKSIEADADIPVPIGKYAQLSGGLTEETVKALEESTYFTRGGMSMKTLERAKAEVEAFNNNLVDATEKKAQRVKESIIRDEFEDASDVDREVLEQVFSNPTQVKQAYNNLYKNLVQDYRENYASDFDNMDNDIKEATASGVEPQWLTDYKSNNGGKAPRTNAERRRAAYHSSVAKAQTTFADNTEALNQSNIHHADMEHMLMQIESLEAMKDKVFEIADKNVALRMNLTKAGHEVYTKVRELLETSTKGHIKQQAHEDALLVATHADVFAQIMREAGNARYTAMDYLNTLQINVNGKRIGNGYAQKQDTRNLVAYHNMSADSLSKALKLGGLPVPSVAITKKDIEYNNFGDISLVIPKEVIDPKTTPIFSRDAWTQTFPYIYKAWREENASALYDEMLPVLKELNAEKGQFEALKNPMVMGVDDSTSINFVERIFNKEETKYYFLSTIGKAPKIKYAKRKDGSTYIDSVKLREDVEKKLSVKSTAKAFEAWKNEISEKLLGEPKIEVKGRKVDLTLENVVEAMVGQQQNKQKGALGNTKGSVIAASAKRIKSMKSLKTEANNKISGDIDIEDESNNTNKAYEDVKQEIDAFMNDMVEHYAYNSTFDAFNDALQVLIMMQQKNKSFDVAARSNDFTPTDEMREKAEKLVEQISNLPVRYFEAKPQRAVKFNEIKAAIVPKGTEKTLIKELKSHGIHIEEYEQDVEQSRLDAIKRADDAVEVYFQNINGMTTIKSQTERIVELFKTADKSTFMHEMGHVFFDDIQKLASMDNAPKQLLDDWNALKEWSGWVDGENVDNTKAHEKFARGWESYLRSGEAPTKGLQRVFRQFSKWLTRIYRSVQRLGGEVPSDIKDIMARMIATQDDIENYAHEQALEQFENTKLYQQLSETEQARVQGYIADIKEKAKERVMRKYMKELDNRPIKEWEDVKDDVQSEIEKRLADTYPTYREHRKYDALGDAALVNTQYGNIENLKKAEIEETGATFEDAIKQEMEHARSEFVEVNNIGKSNEQIAEEMLLSNQGQMALTEEEAKLIKQYTNKDLANNWQLLDKLQRLDPNTENLDAELAPIEKAITKAEQIKQDNAKVAKELNSTSKELDKAEDKIEKLKAQLQERINAVRTIRDGGFGTIPKYMNKARAELGDLTLAQASQYKKYQNQAIRDGKNADRALAVNKVEEALEHKQSQMMNQARARVAFENQQRIKKLRTKLLEQNARITRAKNPVMLDPQLRYFYTHMMYQMGLIRRDGLIPTDGFDETVITNRLDPDAGIAGFNTLISMDDTVSGIFNAKSPRTFATLTVNELNMLEELMTGMYQNGRREYEHNSFLTENGNPLSIDDVERDILDKAIETFGEVEESTFNIENSKTTKNAISNKMANFVESLQQTKTILRRLDGGKGGPAEMYIYDTINRARQHFNERLESETMRLAKNVALYSRKELYKIRNERGYQVGDARNLTKEQVMALALNWGTERNRQRAIETVKANEVEIERLFQDVLDDRDWEFIIREWEQINSFYPERSAVQERMTGNPLKKEEGITFRIGGRTIEGQYYPIMYDPKTSGKSSNHEMEDIAQSFMSSNATFGYGMSATKSRLDKVKDKQLLLSLDVIPRAITESINHIAMREAVTDVNTLINRKEFADYITNKLGASEYQYLRQWVRDQWTTEVSRLTEFDNMMQTIKRNISSAVMAGKVSVAIQNVANIPVAMEQLGAARVMRALYRAGVGVYGRGSGRYTETYEFVLGKSVMLRERAQTLDKDMRRGLEIGGKGFTIDGKSIGGYTMEQLGEARDAINSWGYSLLSETDLMLSVPIWKDVYDVEYSKLVQKEGISLEWADQRAIELADKAIIDIFGSGDIKDQAGIQRNKGTIANFATTFYTYAGTLWNMQLDGFYAFKDRGDFKKFARVIFYDLFMQAVIMVIYNNLFGSDDDDDPTKVAKSLTKEFVNQSVMGVPFVREGITQAMNRMLGEKVYNRGTSPLSYAVIDKIDDIFTAVNSSKKDWTDVGRAGLQFANSMTGLSNTLTDGVMTIAKYGLTDIDAELEDLLYSVIFDKRLKSKKEKQKEKKQNKH